MSRSVLGLDPTSTATAQVAITAFIKASVTCVRKPQQVDLEVSNDGRDLFYLRRYDRRRNHHDLTETPAASTSSLSTALIKANSAMTAG
jgi:hypothetical protein